MSVQTTHRISREEAEKRYVEKSLVEERLVFERCAREVDDNALTSYLEDDFNNYEIITEAE